MLSGTHLHLTCSHTGCRCGVAGDVTLDCEGRYFGMSDHRAIDACRPAHTPVIPAELGVVKSPLRASEWEEVLGSHPDREFARYIVTGIREGFRIGYDYGQQLGRKRARNMRSASEHPEPIDNYVQTESREGRLIRAPDRAATQIAISRVGVIPKLHQPGKWRLITDLSSPKGESVNDGIRSEICSVSYASTDDAVRCIIIIIIIISHASIGADIKKKKKEKKRK